MASDLSVSAAREAIERTFGSLPVPPGPRHIRPLLRPDGAGSEATSYDLTGRTWQSLPVEVLRASWAHLKYLSPVEYCYYLPALLMAAIDNPHDDDLMSSAVFGMLRPSLWELYYNGDDADFRTRQAAFADEQYAAVARFLGYAFAGGGNKDDAAQALRFGWNRLDTPALRAALEYYREMHSFTCPIPAVAEVAGLIEQIQTAFAETPYPGDHDLCGSTQGDEPATYAMELRGTRWQSLHPELLARNYGALSFLTDAGFRYFLPAFLVSNLLEYESNCNPVFTLTHGLCDPVEFDYSLLDNIPMPEWIIDEHRDIVKQYRQRKDDTDWRAYALARFAGFTRPEREATVRYLEYRADDEFEALNIRQALDSYWLPSLNELR